MANRFFSEVSPTEKDGGAMRKPSMKENRGSFNVKPSFPSAALPGKTQPRDRSGGVRRAKIHPKSEGL